MDLKRRLGLATGGGQSYELIRSTQSLVDRLNLNSEDISIQPVHPSIMGQVSFIIINTKSILLMDNTCCLMTSSFHDCISL